MPEKPLADADIRPVLIDKLRAAYCGREGTIVVPELDLRGLARIDVAVVNNRLSGWEIKSDRDSLRRLADQASIYSRIFDLVYLVVTERHLVGATLIIPGWWGVEVVSVDADGCVELNEARRGRYNRNIDELMVTGLLWVVDMVQLLRQHDAAPDMRKGSYYQLRKRVLAQVPFSEIRKKVCTRLTKGQGARRGVAV